MIGPETRAALHRLRDTAAERPVDVVALQATIKTASGKQRHRERTTAQTVVIPGPWVFMVTYSVETGHPSGTCRHMSMSIDREGRAPNHHAVWLVAEELGFAGTLDDCVWWTEELQGHGVAINVVQPMQRAMA
jgi:hypothetical protein